MLEVTGFLHIAAFLKQVVGRVVERRNDTYIVKRCTTLLERLGDCHVSAL